jgi:hypothetical protein
MPAIDAPPLDWDELRSLDAAWSFLAVSDHRDLDIFGSEGRQQPETVVVFAWGKRCGTPDDLFREFAAAFQFPEYFGHGWDAFRDCLTDLAWFEASSCVCVVTNIDALLSEHPKDFEYLADDLQYASSYWASRDDYTPPEDEPPLPKVRFATIFHSKPENVDFARKRLEEVGVHPPLRSVPDDWKQRLAEREAELEKLNRQRIRRLLNLPPEP